MILKNRKCYSILFFKCMSYLPLCTFLIFLFLTDYCSCLYSFSHEGSELLPLFPHHTSHLPLQSLLKLHFQNLQWLPSSQNDYPLLSSVQSLSRVRLFATPGLQHSRLPLSFTISRSLLKLMSIQWVMPSNHLILCRPLLLLPSVFPSIRVFSNESGGQSIGASASASVLPMNIQD